MSEQITQCGKCNHLDDSHSPECPIGGDVRVTESADVAKVAPVKSDLNEVVELPKVLTNYRGSSAFFDGDSLIGTIESNPTISHTMRFIFAAEIARRWNRHEGLVEENKELRESLVECAACFVCSCRNQRCPRCRAEALLNKLNNQGE